MFQGGQQQPPPINQMPMGQPSLMGQPSPINQMPMGQPPLNQQPLDQQPMGQPPLDQQPMGQPPLNQQPLEQQPLEQQPLEQQPLNQQPLNQQPLTQQPLEQPPLNQQPLEQPPLDQQPLEQPSLDQQQPSINQLPMSQPPLDQQQPLVDQLPIEHENYPNADYLYNKITSQNFVNNIKTYVCAFTINKDIDTHFVKYIVQHKDSYVTFPSFNFEQLMSQPPNEPLMSQPSNEPLMTQPPQLMPQQVPGQMGGFQDDSSGDENPLDTNFKTKVIEFVKTNIYGGLLEPSYIGYIPNISEQDAVFVFVKIDDAHNKHFMGLQSTEFFESIPNELFHLSKVFNFDVEQPVKDFFTNNKWLYMEQPLASPFSGYLCKLEGTEIKNAGIGEEPGNFNINIDNIGDFFYFSFLPLDPNNTNSYQRYALLPMEYECILDNSNLEYYKQNMMLYQNSNSIYFKGEILSNQKEGNQFFAIRSPTQFTQL